MTIASLYVDTARAFARAVSEIPDARWEAPGLGEWTVRSLVGHTARSIDTVLDYLPRPEPTEITLPTAEDYYAVLLAHSQPQESASAEGAPGAGASSAAITARGVAAGEALGDDPAGAVRAKAEAVDRLLAGQRLDRPVAVRGSSMPLAEYLRTRLFELVVHSLDIERATGVRTAFPTGAVLEAARLAAGIATAAGTGEQLLLALTGRSGLPPGFSVV